jgi:hypothetical protein
MIVEGKLFRNIDIVALSSTQESQTAITINIARIVEDGAVSIEMIQGQAENPKISGIEISLVAPHLAQEANRTVLLTYSIMEWSM